MYGFHVDMLMLFRDDSCIVIYVTQQVTLYFTDNPETLVVFRRYKPISIMFQYEVVLNRAEPRNKRKSKVGRSAALKKLLSVEVYELKNGNFVCANKLFANLIGANKIK